MSRTLALTLAVLALLLLACRREARPEENPAPPAGDCSSDRDCGGNAICDKSNDDDDIPPADDELGFCVEIGECTCNGEPIPCRRICEPAPPCDPRDEQACADAGERCLSVDGVARCALAPEVDHCELVFSPRVAVAGDPVAVGVLGFGADNRLVRAPGFSVVAACEVGVCEQRVEAGCGAAVLRVYAADFTGSHRVIVVDELGLAIVGANVRFTAVDTGTALGEVSTDAFGIASVDLVGDLGDNVVVAVAAAGFEGHTIADPPRDLLVGTRRETPDVTGARTSVDAAALHTRGDVHLGISGAALSTNLDRFSFEALFGARSEVLVDIGGLTDGGERVPLPAGVTFALGDTPVRAQALVTARPPGDGRLWLWNLTAAAPLSRVGAAFADRGLNDLPLDLLDLPLRFDHDAADVVAAPGVVVAAADDNDGNGVPDALPTVAFPEVIVRPDTLTLFSDSPIDPSPDHSRVFAVVVAVVPGGGLVPLGMRERSADDDDNSFVDFTAPHDGMEAFAVKTLVMAYDERPWAPDAALALRTGEEFAGAPVVGVVADHVIVDDSAGVDVVHVVAATAGHREHFWARVIVDVDTVAAAGVSFAGADSVVVEGILLDGPSDRFRLGNDGGLDDVVALTRVGPL